MWGAAIVAGISSILWFSVCCVVLGNIVSCIYKSLERSEVDEKKKGLKPYSDYYPYEKSGSNKIFFKTSKGCDYVIIVKDTCGMIVNHAYKRRRYFYVGCTKWCYNIFFYTDRG